MHKLLYDRVRLIRGLQLALNNGFSDQEKHAIANIVTTIRTDHHHHFLSYSQEENGKVSYAKYPSHMLDTVKRIRTALGKYIRRQCGIGKDDFMHVRQQRQVYAFLYNQPRQGCIGD